MINTRLWKNRFMVLCMSILILGFLWVLLYSTIHGAVKTAVRQHPALYDFAVIKLVLTGEVPATLFKKQQKDISIKWASLYPFEQKAPQTTHSSVVSIVIPPKIFNHAPAHKLSTWANHNLPDYYGLAEIQHAYEARIHWKFVNPATNVINFGDGYWTFLFPKVNVNTCVQSIRSLHEFTSSLGIPLLYVQNPHKTNAYGDAWINGRYDFVNENDDHFLTALKQNHIDYLDLRESFHHMVPNDHYHQLFFRTDHHWLPQTALMGARILAETLHQKYDIDTDVSALSSDQFQVELLPEFFLGSQGKKITLAQTTPDDFPILHPTFPTSLHMKLPNKDLDVTGPFEITYDKNRIAYKDFYNQVPYDAYAYGNPPYISLENLNLPQLRNQKILILKDSFGSTLVPLMSLGCKHIIALDLRAFTGSLHALIQKEKPDVIVISYTGALVDSINWGSHRDLFDFR